KISQEKISQAALGNAPSAKVTYDQVVYIDGLVGHEPSRHASSVRHSGRTLAEIAEPIAFGAGTPASVPLQSNPRREASTTLNEAGISRRSDSTHGKKSAEVPPATSAPIHNSAARLNSGLPLPVAFNPSWEVDLFFWPEVVKQIEASHPEAFRQIGKHLSLANRDGLKVMAITSGERGVGRSTVAMHMARCAAASGLRVALLDGDTYCPSLIDQLRLDSQQGWQDCLFENTPLNEIAIHSIADRITLFPLTSVISQQQVHANLHRMAKLIRRIANAFDMVFIDANRLNLEQRDMVGAAQETVIDAAIIVVDTELSIREKVDSAVSILRAMGISSIGLVENFQS
ncbi:MAG TPA: P-loop NTPase, partial [Pirellula sp.]|nr:P-loop NTPase [Pirellula sp.]